MVVLTIVAQENDETVYFDEPIPQVHYMRLVSCSLYNSWHNLKRVGQISSDRAGIRGWYQVFVRKKAELIFKLKQMSLIQCLNFSTQFTTDIQPILVTLWPT